LTHRFSKKLVEKWQASNVRIVHATGGDVGFAAKRTFASNRKRVCAAVVVTFVTIMHMCVHFISSKSVCCYAGGGGIACRP